MQKRIRLKVKINNSYQKTQSNEWLQKNQITKEKLLKIKYNQVSKGYITFNQIRK